MARHFLTLTDISRRELQGLLRLGRALKAGEHLLGPKPLDGKALLILFHKPSTRTRLSFQVGMYQLGGLAIELRSQELQIIRGETVSDTARICSRYADGVVIRTFRQEDLEEWSRHADIPIINGLSDRFHPCQILADILTIREYKGSLEGLKVVYIGDGNNVLHSWITAACLADFDLVMATPPGFDPDPSVLAEADKIGFRGRRPRIVRDPEEAVAGADVIYTDVWTSMGQEEEHQGRLKAFEGYQVNEALVRKAGDKAIVMHCLPAHRGEEITPEVMAGHQAVIFDQAENRLHMQKALLLFLLTGSVDTAGLPPDSSV